MENQKKHIEIVIDPSDETVSLSVENVTGGELIDGYLAIAGAVVEMIVKHNDNLKEQNVLNEIARRLLRKCLSGEEDSQ